jgi:hypothetical protein
MALKDNIVACYEMNETSGTTAVDASANGYDGTIVGSVTINQTGKLDKAYSFPGSGTATVDLPAGAKITGTTPRTFALWIKVNASISDGTLVSYGDADFNKFFDFHVINSGGTNRLFFQKYGAVYTSGSSLTIPDDTWTFVFLRYSGSTVRVGKVVSGTVTYEDFSVGTIDTGGTTNPRIGDFSFAVPAVPYWGLIDQVSIWNAEKTDDDLIAIENNGSGLAYADWDSGGGATFTPRVMWWG